MKYAAIESEEVVEGQDASDEETDIVDELTQEESPAPDEPTALDKILQRLVNTRIEWNKVKGNPPHDRE